MSFINHDNIYQVYQYLSYYQYHYQPILNMSTIQTRFSKTSCVRVRLDTHSGSNKHQKKKKKTHPCKTINRMSER